ncbi:MAG TPA: bifunctional phosphoglucose/phosphomannose isomerase [Candidatus Saccharimonadales bacterium]|nr:bifunctional phosphoglucose/phosphomannose isomerase [Candidatus Saccharimonadales bacterium]
MSEQIVVLDDGKMLEKIQDLPNQLEKTWTTHWIKDLALPNEFDQVLIAGMGGSGIAGALAQELFAAAPTPIFTWADYNLPHWADDETLFIAISYSGETEETLSAVKQAAERKIPALVITSGGKMEGLAEMHGLPVVKLQPDLPPRAAIGELYGSLLVALAKTGHFPFKEGDLFRAIEEIRSSISKRTFEPKAEALAMSLNNELPIIAAAAPLGAVARRFATQLNENSKTTAFPAALPELCHNLIAGLEFAIPEKLTVLLLESSYSFSRNVARAKVVSQSFENQQIPVVPLSVQSSSQLGEQLLLLHFGDLLSYYLAGVYGVDPTPVEEIATLKEALKKI